MKVWEFEEAVWNMEEIRIVIRAEPEEEVGAYPFERRSAGNTKMSVFLQGRITENLNGKGFFVVDGHGDWPHGNTLLRTVRGSYE